MTNPTLNTISPRSWKKYPKYKNSGVEWLGEAPNEWKIQKLKFFSSIKFSTVDKKTEENEKSVLLCNYVDVYKNDFITSDLDFMKATASPNEIALFSLKKGDILITKDSEEWMDIAIPAFVTEDMKNVLCGYHLAQIRPKTDISFGEYLFRSFSARGINDQFRVAANGITRYGIGQYWINNAIFLLPSLFEQSSITSFLNRETARIDALMAKKERQIELLREKRAVLIKHAVTMGLDPKMKMKDSSMEWIPKIPEHWKEMRARDLYRQLFLPPKTDAGIVTVFRDGQVTLREKRRTEGFTNAILEVGYQSVRDGDLVIHSMDAFAGAIGVSDSDGKCTGEYVVCEPLQDDLNNFYFGTLLRVMALEKYIFAICPSVRERAPRFRFNTFKDVLLPVPPVKEQNDVISYINNETTSIDTLIEKIQHSLNLLSEYRTAIVSAAVTGKIDVRQEATA